MPQSHLPDTSISPLRSKARRLRVVLWESNNHVNSYIQRTIGSECELTSIDRSTGDDGFPHDGVEAMLFGWVDERQSLAGLRLLRRRYPEVPVVLLCGSIDESARRALASLEPISILFKPFTGKDLREIIDRLQKTAAPTQEAKESVLDASHSFVRASQVMHAIERQAALVAPSDIPVLILGESGTGKEILATFVHSMSKRKNYTFLKINCAAMPAELLESELFGYEQGAFTGAHKMKPGKFEVCNGGTIFLDEIGEMPSTLQAKLLQVLQDGSYSRLGGRTTLKTNVRVISATNVAMKKAIVEGTFREDLYYRLNGISLRLPPLRQRKEEIPILVQHFLLKGAKRFGVEMQSVSPQLQSALMKHDWPGNLRELENLMNRLLVLRDESEVLSEISENRMHVLSPTADVLSSTRTSKAVGGASRKGPDRETIMRTLEENRWNRRATADALQINYKTLLSKIRLYNLDQESA